MDEAALLALASKFGPVALIGVIVLQWGLKALKARFTPAAPDPASPIPAPTADSKHPVMDAILKAMFGKAAPAARNANPELIQKIKDEVNDILYSPK
mgnify:CR=1 FL=1